MYTKKNIFLEYAVASSAASFKVGLSNLNTGFFHLDITCDAHQIDVFFDEMKKRENTYGLVTMCVGTGQGAAGIFERL